MGAFQAQAVTPMDVLRNLRSIELGPGQTSLFRNPGFGGGEMDALTRGLGSGYIATGVGSEEVEHPGQMIGTSGVRGEGTKIRRSIPPSFEAEVTITPDEIKAFKQRKPMPSGAGVPAPKPVTPPVTATQQVSGVPVTPSSVYDIPPHIAKQLEDPRHTPQAKQEILMEYYRSLIGQQDPSLLDRLFPSDAKSVFKKQNQNELRRLLTPNY